MKLTERERSYVIQFGKKRKPKITALKIAKNVEINIKKVVCSYTSRKILKKNGYHGSIAWRKSHVSLAYRQKQVTFTKKYIKKPPEFCEKVIFSDASNYFIIGTKENKSCGERMRLL